MENRATNGGHSGHPYLRVRGAVIWTMDWLLGALGQPGFEPDFRWSVSVGLPKNLLKNRQKILSLSNDL